VRPDIPRLLRTVVILLAGLGAATALPLRPAGVNAAAAQVTGVGSLRGRVDIRRVMTMPMPRPGINDLGTVSKPEVLEGPRAVVYLESPDVPDGSILRSQGKPSTGHARMDQRDETFTPHVLAIDAGTLVDFPNNDQTFHNVFSLSKARRFDLGRYGRGKSKTIRFDKPGIVRVFCDIHSHMNAFIIVFNHPFHAMTDDDGRYRIDNIPPGTYTVTAWHEGEARDMHSITIPSGGGVVGLDLLVQ
jgi:plastocyanin